MADLQDIADRVEIEALRAEFTGAVMLRDRASGRTYLHDRSLTERTNST